ncbi:ATP-binding cassette domain-containing protein [Geodermatophilus sp. YIM 151500]|uniref:ATP-binding cassette domain-containing protein n=1 Tax=Geodermatophilus sp. YIM 151500 TaxID=2984531 RepID=UPI0021E4C596|nr:ATP-binding cassette domain-containing protein [Geodermatophilus sp. YIM 151500]MCV2491558.1 ATP-binding cassette domain-containing protein [Geodermatophilus sp. YIM 151500]
MDQGTMARDASVPLVVRLGGRSWVVPPGGSLTIGRDVDAEVHVDHGLVSRRHASVGPAAGGWLLTDHSRNGVFIDGQRSAQVLVTTPTSVELGHPVHGVRMTLTPIAGASGPGGASPTHARRTGQHSVSGSQISIGRLAGNDVVVDDLLVSRHHAVVERTPRGWHLRDLGSTNGTHLNGRRVDSGDVAEGDVIGVGPALLQLRGDRLLEYRDQGDVDIEAEGLVVTRQGRRLLDGVDLRIPGSSLVAVLGPSGAGKSTLLAALAGTRPADDGVVRYGGRDLYGDYDELRHRIGVVPQDDILHPQLTVSRALSHAARLRFSTDVPREDRERRIAEVLGELGLADQASQRISSLSGGQRKRTSVALELLTRPSLLFLDEPTSGLDPGLDKQVMRTLRGLADRGQTVVVVTHSVLNLDACDRLVILARGGRVAYDGPPGEALGYFGVATFADVFLRLEDDPLVDWRSRPRAGLVSPLPGRSRDRSWPAGPVRSGAGLVQFGVVARRTLDVLLADRTYLAFLAFLPVVLSGLAHATPSPRGLTAEVGDPRPAQLLLVLVLGGALMGTASSIRELVKERSIFQRERAIGLSGGAYLAAKVLVLAVVTFLQVAVFAALSMLGRPGPRDPVLLPWGEVEIGLVVAAVTVASMVLGLVISSLISNADRGMPLLVMVVMLQLVLSGGLFVLDGRAGLDQLSWAVPARWAYAMGSVSMELGGTLTPPVDDPLWRPSATTWLADVLVLTGLVVVMLLAVHLGLRRDEPLRRRSRR